MIQILIRIIPIIWISFGGVSVLPASAQNVRLMMSGGGSYPLDRKVRNLDGISYGAHFTGQIQLGILAAIELHPPLAVEVGFRNEWSTFHPQGGDLLPPGKAIRFRVQQAFLNTVYHTSYSDGGLRLFATAGMGLRRLNPGSDLRSDVGWSLNFGGGIEARLRRRISIRVEVRDFVGGMPRFLPSQSIRGLFHDIQPSIGCIVHL